MVKHRSSILDLQGRSPPPCPTPHLNSPPQTLPPQTPTPVRSNGLVEPAGAPRFSLIMLAFGLHPTPPHPTTALPFNVVAFPSNAMPGDCARPLPNDTALEATGDKTNSRSTAPAAVMLYFTKPSEVWVLLHACQGPYESIRTNVGTI